MSKSMERLEEALAQEEATNVQLRARIAELEAQQEPVVWMYVNKSTHETKFQKHMRDFVDHGLWAEVPLYGEPLANHELQCVCGAVWLGDEMVHLPDKRPPARKPEDIRNATLDEIAAKIEAMPFGDTAASFAVWIREQKQ